MEGNPEKIVIKAGWWECFSCKERKENGKTAFLQVDAIHDDSMLLSSYHDQRFVLFNPETEKPLINAPYCIVCVENKMRLVSRHVFEEEDMSLYTFEMNGFTCRDAAKEEAFTRHCGKCDGCDKELVLKSKTNFTNKEVNHFFMLWAPCLSSLSFPDAMSPKVWRLEGKKSQFYPQYGREDPTKPLFLCHECHGKEPWIADEGPITCPLCEAKRHRWIFHHDKSPVKLGSGCYCHVYPYPTMDKKEVIMDGYIDYVEYVWKGPKPDAFDNDRPFCYDCLENMKKEGLLGYRYDEDSDSDSDSDDSDAITLESYGLGNIMSTLFPDHEEC